MNLNSFKIIFRGFKYLFFTYLLVCFISCKYQTEKTDEAQFEPKHALKVNFNLDEAVNHCKSQLEIAVPKLTDLTKHPRYIETDSTQWEEVPNGRLLWTSGFYPGILWYMYDLTKDKKWENEATRRTEVFESFKTITEHHDIGFMMFPPYGKGYDIGGKKAYKDILLTSAASLATRFNPKVGTIKSWSNKMHPRWKQHITIIDNMINLELLFWASKHGGDHRFYDIAVKHSETTMKNHFRSDYTSWHVLEYDSITGKVLNRNTKQGYSDDSRWARGQAWGLYGFTMVYRETKDKKFLNFAKKLSDKYMSMLPEDYVPYWDFDAPNIPNEEKDASAAAIAASGLLELSTYVENKEDKDRYYNAALKMLVSLSSDNYSGVGKTDSFLVHSVGAKPLGSEVDVALIYADYYYIEALDRLEQIKENRLIK